MSLKTDINLFFTITNGRIARSRSLTRRTNFKFMCLSAYWRQKLANERARISAVIVKRTLVFTDFIIPFDHSFFLFNVGLPMVSWTGHSPLCGAGEKSHKEHGSLLLLIMVRNQVVGLSGGFKRWINVISRNCEYCLWERICLNKRTHLMCFHPCCHLIQTTWQFIREVTIMQFTATRNWFHGSIYQHNNCYLPNESSHGLNWVALISRI